MPSMTQAGCGRNGFLRDFPKKFQETGQAETIPQKTLIKGRYPSTAM
jgi:hypothetical protein